LPSKEKRDKPVIKYRKKEKNRVCIYEQKHHGLSPMKIVIPKKIRATKASGSVFRSDPPWPPKDWWDVEIFLGHFWWYLFFFFLSLGGGGKSAFFFQFFSPKYNCSMQIVRMKYM